jgi:hypothetical protein
MSLFSKLFGGGASAPEPTPEDYKGYSITATPHKEGARWRIGARIEKDGRTHDLIRADVLEDREAADAASIGKAKQMIDEQGDRLFG